MNVALTRRSFHFGLAVCALLAAWGIAAASASAATIVVSSLADSGTGTLRAAVAAAGEGDTIVLPAGTITLTSGRIETGGKALTIVGAGARQTTLDGNHSSEILNTTKALSVSGVTFADGAAAGGGAIETEAPLTLSQDAFVNNHATSTGGAIVDEGPNNGTAEPLTVEGVLFEGNSAKSAGGAFAISALGTAKIVNSTFAGNSSEGESGAIELSLASPNTTLTLLNDTFLGNSAPTGRGGVFRNGSSQTIRYRNTVFAADGVTGKENVCESGGGAEQISDGHNFLDVEDENCKLTAAGDHGNAVVKLGTLGNHGGPTDTILPLAGSPLIDGGDNTGCPLFDQRGVPRPFGPACDVGAVEITPPAATTGLATSVTTSSVVLNGIVNSRGLGGATWWFEWGPSTAYGNLTPTQASTGLAPEGVGRPLVGLPASTALHYRLVVSDSDGTSYGADQVFTTSPPLPVLTGLRQSQKRWTEGKALAQLARRRKAKRAPVGTVFGFTLNVPANVSFEFTRLVPGRLVKRHCVAPSHSNRRHPACTSRQPAGVLPVAAHAGANKLSFQGVLANGKRLPLGSYSVSVHATDSAGSSVAQRLSFTIVKR